MIAAGLASLVHGASVTIQVTGLNPETVTIGQLFTLTAQVSGGVLESPVQGGTTGYHLWWFPGTTNGTGAINARAQWYPVVPSGCDATLPCDTPVAVQESFEYNNTGSYDISVTVYDAQGNYAIATDVVTVAPPTLSLSAVVSDAQAAEDQSLTFTATPQIAASSYADDRVIFRWDFGDGSLGYGNPVQHFFADAGIYSVSVTGFDNRTGAVARAFEPLITITNPPPVAAFTAPRIAIEDAPVHFSAAPTQDVPTDIPLLRFEWNFGDGSLGAGPNATHIYTETGRYAVELTVMDDEDLVSLATGYVDVTNPAPTANAGSPVTVPVGTVSFLNASNSVDVPSDAPFLNYTWTSPVGQVTYGVIGRASFFTPTGIGSPYTVGLKLRDDEGQIVSSSALVSVQDVAPTVGVYSIYARANITLYIAGTKYQAVFINLSEDGVMFASGTIIREPGDPFVVGIVFPNVTFQLANYFDIQMTYLPDYLNGIPEAGDNPAWLNFTYWGNGTNKTSLYHDFNNQQTGTYVWSVNASAVSAGEPVYIQTQAFSPAQTRLNVTWAFGDGSHVSLSAPPPASPEPSLDTFFLRHRWPSGRNYAFEVTVADAFGGVGHDSLEVTDTGELEVNDTAPLVSMNVPSSPAEETSTAFGSNSTDADRFASPLRVSWDFGDGQAAAGANVTHVYRYGATVYAVVVYSSSRGGSTTANWSFIDILNPLPEPAFRMSPASAIEGTAVTLAATGSSDTPDGPLGLVYGWDFGDGAPGQGPFGSGLVTTHVFTYEATFAVTLTVTDEEGATASITETIGIEDQTPTATLADRTVTVDEFVRFSPTTAIASPADTPLLRGTWGWGDGSPSSSGFSAGHTYLEPGSYAQTLVVTNPDGTYSAMATATITVVDQPVFVALPYNGFAVYGENHTASFTATALGSLADRQYGGDRWTFAWSFGDGGVQTDTGQPATDTAGHVYAMPGNPTLGVTVTSPFQSMGNASSTLTSVPDSDGDGLPNVYEQLITHTSPYKADSTGSGLTDYVKIFVVGGAAAQADTDTDGLTDFQEVFGTATGYVSNPLDPNTAGDGILDGQHFFSDSYVAPKEVPLSPNGKTVQVPIPDATYQGFAPAFNQSRLFVEINSTDSPSEFSLTLVTPGGSTFVLGSPASLGETFYLLNSTPLGGQRSAYGLGLTDFMSPEASVSDPWELNVTDSGSNGGSVPEVTMAIAYYTNPSLADPTRSGLLEGHGFTTPLFNCSAPAGENFTELNGATFTYTSVHFWPYTESYYKLSVLQGIPYVAGQNASQAVVNNAIPACPVANEPYSGGTASYLGDADYGIPTWNPNDAGDGGLTNGMKALGATAYAATSNRYQSASGLVLPAGFTGYPADPVSYPGPLNPTSLSTAADGTPDSQAVNPVTAFALGVTINSAVDPTCELGTFSFDPAQDAVSVTVTSVSGNPTVFTPLASGTGGSTCFAGIVPVGTQNWGFDFNGASYTLPLDNADSTFTFELQLWHNLDPTGGSKVSLTFTDLPLTRTGPTSFSESGISGSYEVQPLERMPTVLIHGPGETQDLPGYGLRWEGEQRFYAFFLDVSGASGPSSSDPFTPGENVILESRDSFLTSPLNSSLFAPGTNGTNLPSVLRCLSGVQATVRGAGTSQVGTVGTFSASATDACAESLLAALLPLNSTGATVGQSTSLSPTQLALLGLNGQTQLLVPLEPLPGYESPQGSAPPSLLGAIVGFVVGALTFFVGVLIAVGDFVVSLAEEVGQAILGALDKAFAALQDAVTIVIRAVDVLLQFLILLFEGLVNIIITALTNAVAKAVQLIALPALSIAYLLGTVSLSQFNGLAAAVGLDPAPQNQSQADLALDEAVTITAAVGAAFLTVGTAIEYLGAAVSGGGDELALEASQTALSKLIPTVIKAIFGLIAPALGIAGALLLLSDASQGISALGLTGKIAGVLSAASGLFLSLGTLARLKAFGFKLVMELASDITSLLFLALEVILARQDPQDFTPAAHVVLDGFALYFAVVSILLQVTEGAQKVLNELLSKIVVDFGHFTPFLEAGAAVFDMTAIVVT